MTFPAKGFVAARGNGRTDFLRRYPVFVNSNNAYFLNALVGLNSVGQVINVTAASTPPVLGVIQGLFGEAQDSFSPPRALTFNQPTRGPYLTSGQTGFALVNTDPEQTYYVQYDATASDGLVGKNISASAANGGAGNTRTGISTMNVKASTVSTSADKQLQIVGIAPSELAIGGRGEKAPGCAIEVKLNGAALSYGAKVGN